MKTTQVLILTKENKCPNTICERQTHLLWVEDSDDLCDSSLVECWDNITARGEELQLECLTKR